MIPHEYYYTAIHTYVCIHINIHIFIHACMYAYTFVVFQLLGGHCTLTPCGAAMVGLRSLGALWALGTKRGPREAQGSPKEVQQASTEQWA